MFDQACPSALGQAQITDIAGTRAEMKQLIQRFDGSVTQASRT
jgi:hypothetical protein